MKFASLSLMALMCLALVGWAWGDEKKEDEEKEHAVAKEVLAAAKIDLLKAIETAQAKVPMGKPIYATTEKEHDKLLFEVFFQVGDSETEVEVDAVTGQVVEVEQNEDDDVENVAEAEKALKAAKITFAQAIAAAKEKIEGGKPFEVEFEWEDDKPIIEVELWTSEKVMKAEIDAVSGKVLEVEEE